MKYFTTISALFLKYVVSIFGQILNRIVAFNTV